MTLIALAVKGTSAEIVTDTMAYDGMARRTGHTTKVQLLHHLDAAAMTQGDSAFGIVADICLVRESLEWATFDDMVTDAPEQFRAVWNETRKHDGIEATALLVGWSPKLERFAAYGFAAETDFEPWEIQSTFMMPTPLAFRPSQLEVTRVAGWLGVPPETETDGVLAEWLAQPPVPVPVTEEDWLVLALAAWRQRSLADVASVFIGGHLHLTRLSRGAQLVTRIHTFDEDSEEFRQMVSGTLHPQAQLAPCECGSGQRYIDCCLAGHVDDPCPCDSGRTFGDCCALAREDLVPRGGQDADAAKSLNVSRTSVDHWKTG